MTRMWRGKAVSGRFLRAPKARRKKRRHSKSYFVKNSSRYSNRNSVLKEMGFETYNDYLSSDLWKMIRNRVMARAGERCQVCQKPAVSVHHITYSEHVLRGTDDSQLVAVCHGCHRAAEFDGDTKLTYTSDIAKRLTKRLGKVRRNVKAALWPKCQCCRKQMRKLGRNDICMGCYKSGRALRFIQKE